MTPNPSWTVDASAAELVAALRDAVADYESQERYGEASCPECTYDTTPHTMNKGPCWYHRARALLSRVRS